MRVTCGQGPPYKPLLAQEVVHGGDRGR
jgi:hypothetical protein